MVSALFVAFLLFRSWPVESVEFEDDYLTFINGLNGVEECIGPQLSGLEWVFHHRQPDHGWREQTHRATVILELNKYGSLDASEIDLIKHQLEVELTSALLRNNGNIASTELALYVQALLAIGRDPRDFYGLNLVDKLLAIVSGSTDPHPFLVLVLCSAHAVQNAHLLKLRSHLHEVRRKTGRDRDLAAIAVKTFACAKHLKIEPWSHFQKEVDKAAEDLASLQKENGGFGNVYTSSLIHQALKAYDWFSWDESQSEDYLRQQEKEKANMVSIYLVQMALHAFDGLFLSAVKDIDIYTPEGFLTIDILKNFQRTLYVQYTLKVGEYPEIYHTITVKVPSNITFFDVMRLAAEEDSKFNFSYTVVQNGRVRKPVVYRISDIPNDAENGLYWRLIHETEVDHDRHVSEMTEMEKSPVDIKPVADSHYIFWYCDIFKDMTRKNSGAYKYSTI